ncbi:tRNA methyltransferase complex GCD14 subunit-domain-containing protein [Talaromyces proteolyticus]|uniref:tRNA (adenine(58)-N(1))-methyltransferase catalytic subunit TRM61 n=1 Tax=Talaromyces proteolyticus TaxID=1131652 RepID=A0AAD4Q426_9EURO|nr:tRNA methyltransferase complex GCD14 subunit-domain-containing protein [Talaromyces proteolyticus]KAH8702262.1 tRNA methyltransferase complex GCD14 subunit-domain-containing protein [Talaromyces proteolyticus]
MPSPFLNPGARSTANGLSLLHLRRDNLLPVVLDASDADPSTEKIVTTRFGPFPHSTLLNKTWGSQIASSNPPSNKRGKKALKRKADDLDSTEADDVPASASGFIHIFPPTPESWTSSLPHRTQVVYTPDYSYVLHRLRARPGCTIIEAGAGSGSFTHAAARAVFNGYSSASSPKSKKRTRFGKVCSFEFHAQRAQKIREELAQHGLEDVVHTTHRDVYSDGFLLGDPKTGKSPRANAVFLDLPAPWLALKHLVRNPADGAAVSPLDPSSPVFICTFSPCMEQVQKTISTLRQLGWLSISMVEVNQRRIDVRRELYGLGNEGVRGAVQFPKSVDEAIGKLRSEEDKMREYRKLQKEGVNSNTDTNGNERAVKEDDNTDEAKNEVPVYQRGRLIHRTEPDLKTHTSYLVFAVLPRPWSEEEERRCRERWPSRSERNGEAAVKTE